MKTACVSFKSSNERKQSIDYKEEKKAKEI